MNFIAWYQTILPLDLLEWILYPLHGMPWVFLPF